MYSKSKKLVAEALGTFGLVFFGCGTAIFSGNLFATAVAFGLSILVCVLTVGKISGAHLNPAVSFAMFFDGRMSFSDAIAYTVSQIVGAFCASLTHLILIATSARKIKQCSFGANLFGETGGGFQVNFFGALLTEIILTTVFVLVVLSVTASTNEHTQKNAAWFIGLALTFVHLIGINITGTSVNPARSIAPAVFGAAATSGYSMAHLWVFIVGPMIGSFVAAMLYGALIKGKAD